MRDYRIDVESGDLIVIRIMLYVYCWTAKNWRKFSVRKIDEVIDQVLKVVHRCLFERIRCDARLARFWYRLGEQWEVRVLPQEEWEWEMLWIFTDKSRKCSEAEVGAATRAD